MKRSIYVVKSEAGPVKIGIATNAKKRFSALQTPSPVRLSLEYVAQCDGWFIEKIEIAVHKTLRGKHEKGEWFSISVDEAVAAIQREAEILGCDLTRVFIDVSPITPKQQQDTSRQQQTRRRQLRSPRHTTLAQVLKLLRQRAALSQEQVADRLGRPQRFISQIEVGSHRVTVVELIELAEVLQIDPTGIIRQIQALESLQVIAASPVEPLPQDQSPAPAQAQSTPPPKPVLTRSQSC